MTTASRRPSSPSSRAVAKRGKAEQPMSGNVITADITPDADLVGAALSIRQLYAARLLGQGWTYEATATHESVRVDVRTVYRWMDDPAFVAMRDQARSNLWRDHTSRSYESLLIAQAALDAMNSGREPLDDKRYAGCERTIERERRALFAIGATELIPPEDDRPAGPVLTGDVIDAKDTH